MKTKKLIKNVLIVFFIITFVGCAYKKQNILYNYKLESREFKNYLKEEYLFKNNDVNSFYIIMESNFWDKNSSKEAYYGRVKKVEIVDNVSHNSGYYGLYIYNTAKSYPNFVFLRTEDTIVYFNCKEKYKYNKILSKSDKINDSIKVNILNYIDRRCIDNDNTSWGNGRIY